MTESLPRSELIKDKVVVSGEGPIDAELIFINDMPKKNDVYKGRSLVDMDGEPGGIFDMCLKFADINRDDIRIINISEVRAPKDNYNNFSESEQYAWEQDLIRRINEEHIGPKVLIAMGNHAMKVLTGRNGIINQRGVTSRARSEIIHDCYVVPTYHPGVVTWGSYEFWIQITFDFIKAQRIANTFNEFKIPKFDFIIEPTLEKVLETLDFLERERPFITIDIENPHQLLSAIGIAWSRTEAICIPFYWGNGRNYWTLDEEVIVWKRLAEVIPKLDWGNQHVHFDWRVLNEHGIFPADPVWDSMLMHHCLYSEMPHRLDMITSIFTDLPFYKKDETEEKGSAIRAGKERDHWNYNCYDCVGAFWAIETEREELIEEGLIDVYHRFYADILRPMFDMIMTGVAVDVESLDIVQKDIRVRVQDMIQKVRELSGEHVFILFPEENTVKEKKWRKEEGQLNLSSWQDVDELLYTRLGWGRYKTKSQTGAKTLERLAYREKSELPTLITSIKADRKEAGLFRPENITDGRIKTEYNLMQDTGRLASSKGRRGVGMNLQNVKVGSQRAFFIPEPGHLMVLADQKQAEARIVAMYADDKNMLRVCEAGSIHVANGLLLFGDDFTKDSPLYKIAKALIHGSNYGMGAMMFAQLSGLRQNEAKEYLALYHATYPGIRKIFQGDVRREISKSRTLYNAFGRREVFLDSLEDYRTFNKGFAFKPQSTSTDINKIALSYMSKYFTILMDTHDGLVSSVPEKEVKYAVEAYQEAYNTEIEIKGHKAIIPIDISVGPNWNDQTEIELN